MSISCRSEAKGVPQILTAPAARAEETELEDREEFENGGYYYDGAYTANKRTNATESSPLPPAQARYYDSLLARFKAARASLRCSPPLASVEALRPDQLISFPENTIRVRAQWEEHMMSTDPHPVQVACMDSDTIVGLVRFLGKRIGRMLCTSGEDELIRIGAWIFAGLSRCRDRDELASEEICDLRILAQSALTLQSGGRGEKTDEDEDDTEGGPVRNGDLLDDSANEALPDTSNTVVSMIEKATKASPARQELLSTTCDMIVTIVGEIYGQRDLLESRKRWLSLGT